MVVQWKWVGTMLCLLMLVSADLKGPLTFESQIAWRQTDPEAIALASGATEARSYLDILSSPEKVSMLGKETGDLEKINGVMPEGLVVSKYARLQEGWLFTCNNLNVFLSCANEIWRKISARLGHGVAALINCFEQRTELKPFVPAPVVEKEKVTDAAFPVDLIRPQSADSNYVAAEESADSDPDMARLNLDVTTKEILAAQERLVRQTQTYVQATFVRQAQQRQQVDVQETKGRISFSGEEAEARNDLRYKSRVAFAELQEVQRSGFVHTVSQLREETVQSEFEERAEQLTWYQAHMNFLSNKRDEQKLDETRRKAEQEIARQRQALELQKREIENFRVRSEREAEERSNQGQMELERQQQAMDTLNAKEKQAIEKRREEMLVLYGNTKKLNKDNKQLQSVLDKLKKKIETTEELSRGIGEERDTLSDVMRQRMQELSAIQLEKEVAQRELAEEKRRFESLRDAAPGEFKDAYLRTQERVAEKEAEIVHIKNEISTKEGEIIKLNEDLQKAQAEQEDLKAQKEEMRRQLVETVENLRYKDNIFGVTGDLLQIAPDFSTWNSLAAPMTQQYLVRISQHVKGQGARLSDTELLEMREHIRAQTEQAATAQATANSSGSGMQTLPTEKAEEVQQLEMQGDALGTGNDVDPSTIASNASQTSADMC